MVIQCGTDALNGDPIGQCNLTSESFRQSICEIIKSDLPTLFLGGGKICKCSLVCYMHRSILGGYNFPNAARLWTFLTGIISGIPLNKDIPDDCKVCKSLRMRLSSK